MYSDITGVILAGGKSSRMGTNKSVLKLGGQTIIERIAELMKSIFTDVIVITNTPDEYRFLNLPLYEDIYKWKGPLAGIHSALVHSNSEKIFVVSCDVPLLSEEMVRYLVAYKTDKSVVYCRAAGYHQPLVGIYSRPIVKTIEKIISAEVVTDKSLHTFLAEVDAEVIDPSALPFYSDEIFFNVNRPQDFAMLLKLLEKQ